VTLHTGPEDVDSFARSFLVQAGLCAYSEVAQSQRLAAHNNLYNIQQQHLQQQYNGHPQQQQLHQLQQRQLQAAALAAAAVRDQTVEQTLTTLPSQYDSQFMKDAIAHAKQVEAQVCRLLLLPTVTC
jgi:FKBP-type peptidyl-prolyl cis-trans isomerase (trigger factor)